MSHNSIRARMGFSFKGESHQLDTRIDLDRCLAAGEEMPNFHLLLAKASGIDTYSYLYEVLESHDIEFSAATGVAAERCDAGEFDWPGFVLAAREEAEMNVLRRIAQQILGETDLDGRADLKAALLAAYRAGRSMGD